MPVVGHAPGASGTGANIRTPDKRKVRNLKSRLKTCEQAIAVLAVLLCFADLLGSQNQPQNPAHRRRYTSLKLPLTQGENYVLQDTAQVSFPDFEIIFLQGEIQMWRGADSTLNSGWLFNGRGTVRFRPRHAAEQQQLRRFTDQDILETEFDYLSLRTLRAMKLGARKAILSQNKTPGKAATDFAVETEKILLDRRGYNLAARLFVASTHDTDDFVFCVFRDSKKQNFSPTTYYYVYDPDTHEKVQFLQYKSQTHGKPFNTLCSYPLGDYLEPPPVSTLQITQYNGWIKLDGSRLDADLGVDIYTGGRAVKNLYFQFSNQATLKWVRSEFGDTLEVIRERKENGFTLLLPDTSTAQDTLRLLFSYTGELMERVENRNWYLQDVINWHPRIGYLQRSRYKLVFKYPQELQLVSIGDLLRDWHENGWHLSFYSQSVPAKASTFALGKFGRRSFIGPDSTRIELFGGRFRDHDMLRLISADIANSLFFYSRQITPYGYRRLRVVEGPGLDSQGFPNYINLTWVSFRAQYEGVMEALRSHEVAHQWWGNTVGWRSYHDQWLSEGMAEYMGAVYLAFALPGSNRFEELLHAWYNDIIEGGDIGVSLGLQRFGFSKEALRNSEVGKAGSIYMGVRLGQKASIDYYLSVYEKSAYMIHMLRYYLTDETSHSDARFWELLQKIAKSFMGKDPSTQDIIELVSEYAGEDMHWFFEQWLLGTEIPTFEYGVEFVEADSCYWVRGQVDQKNVSENFKTPVPVSIGFANDSTWHGRLFVQGRQTPFAFGPFAAAPARFDFNPAYTILARTRRK